MFSHVASASSKQTAKRLFRHNFAQRLNFKYNEFHVHCKLKYSGNYLEQISSPLFQIRQPTAMLLHNLGNPDTHTCGSLV